MFRFQPKPNSVHPDQTSQDAESDQGLHSLLVIQECMDISLPSKIDFASTVDPDQASDQGLHRFLPVTWVDGIKKLRGIIHGDSPCGYVSNRSVDVF